MTSEKKNPPKYIYILGAIAASVLTFAVLKAVTTARNDGVSPFQQEQKRAAELEAQNPELAETMRDEAKDAADRVNAARTNIDIAELERENFNSGIAGWIGLKPGMDQSDVEKLLTERFGAAEEGSAPADIQTLYKPKGITAIVMTQTGMADDSVSAQQLYTEFEPVSPMTNKLVFYGLRVKCARGENAGEWTTNLCP